jgi:hypothetical protein
MKTGTAHPISAKNVLASAKRRLRITDTTHDDDLLSLIYEGAQHLWNRDTYIKRTECFEIENLMFRLPDGFIRPLALELVSPNPSEEVSTEPNTRVLYFDKNYLKQCDCEDSSTSSYSPIQKTGQIVDGYWVFNTTTTATHAIMTYEGRNLDEDCLMVIYDYQIRALRSYACYQFARTYDDMYNPQQAESYRQEWMAQRRFLNGEANLREFKNKRTQIKAITSALIYNTNFDI